MLAEMAEKVFYLITGASKGLGRAIAVSFAKTDGLFSQHVNGSVMVLVARNKDDLDETAALIKRSSCTNLQVRVFPADLGDMTALEEAIDRLLQTPDSRETYTNAVLINNAASIGDVTKKMTDHTSLQMIRDYCDLNIVSTVFLTSRFHQYFQSSSTKKTVVNISSLAAIQPMPYTSLYCIGKAARDMSHKILACENENVRALNYAPGPLETDMSMEIQEKSGSDGTRSFFKLLRDEKKIIDPYDTASKMIKILRQDKYKSGDHIDYYDVE